MKFNEKLIELRKKGGLSQEELGYKLNVTRQTVSKWELGQTTPEMDKLVEMSKIFNISVDELVNDTQINSNENVVIEDKKVVEKNDNKRRVIIIVVVIVLLLLILGGAFISSIFKTVNNTFGTVNQQIESANGQAEGIFGLVNKLFNKTLENIEESDKEMEENKEKFDEFLNQTQNEINEAQNKIEINSFNSKFELYQGTEKGISVKSVIDKVVTNNKTETKLLTVKFGTQTLTDTEQIKNIKTQIVDFDDYEVDFEYDDEGYIKEVNIQKL